jgi:hypothetical protein
VEYEEGLGSIEHCSTPGREVPDVEGSEAKDVGFQLPQILGNQEVSSAHGGRYFYQQIPRQKDGG